MWVKSIVEYMAQKVSIMCYIFCFGRWLLVLSQLTLSYDFSSDTSLRF